MADRFAIESTIQKLFAAQQPQQSPPPADQRQYHEHQLERQQQQQQQKTSLHSFWTLPGRDQRKDIHPLGFDQLPIDEECSICSRRLHNDWSMNYDACYSDELGTPLADPRCRGCRKVLCTDCSLFSGSERLCFACA